MGRLLKVLLFGVACLFALTGPAVADALSDAQRAYDEGNYAKAARLFRPLATKGSSVAQFKLGTLYYTGNGAAKNPKEAEKLFRRAAEQGHVAAQSNLATMYYSGVGIRQDFVLAHMWKEVAASQAEGERQKRYNDQLAELEKSMNATQVSEARKLAKKCIANKFKRCTRKK